MTEENYIADIIKDILYEVAKSKEKTTGYSNLYQAYDAVRLCLNELLDSVLQAYGSPQKLDHKGVYDSAASVACTAIRLMSHCKKMTMTPEEKEVIFHQENSLSK